MPNARAKSANEAEKVTLKIAQTVPNASWYSDCDVPADFTANSLENGSSNLLKWIMSQFDSYMAGKPGKCARVLFVCNFDADVVLTEICLQ